MNSSYRFHIIIIGLCTLLLCALIPSALVAGSDPTNVPATVHLSAFAAGDGPSHADGVYRLLKKGDINGQSNAIAFDHSRDGTYRQVMLRCKLRVLEGGDGGAFIFLNTAEYGKRGPAPFVKSWVEPNLVKTFAVGIDVHNPQSDDPFDAWGNYRGLPEREVSLHWDGREIVKRLAPAEFRGQFAQLEIFVQHVVGGAEVTVLLAEEVVFDRYFIAGMLPYDLRLAIGAGTRSDITTEFDVLDLVFTQSEPARPQRFPKHFEIFNHVRLDNSATFHEKELTLPPPGWEYGRVILTLQIHDARLQWDKWDRNGYVYVVGPDGVLYDIVPFITSFRTPGLWKVDVSHFRPWLAGEVTLRVGMELPFEEDKGCMLSISLDFYHGRPDMEAYKIVPLWVGTAKYRSAENHFSDFFIPQAVRIDASAKAARLFMTTTGHSKIGEFTPSRRTVIFAPEKDGDPAAEKRFGNILWKSDNYLNSNRPQFGTWKYARAGWAPGDVVQPWWIDLTPYIIPGKTAELRYEPEPYDFSKIEEDEQPEQEQVNQAVHLVRSYLILYRTAADLKAAPALQVLDFEEGSRALKAGVLAGDYIESYDGRRPASIQDLRDAIKAAEEEGKKRVIVVIYRGIERLEMEIAPGRMGVLLEES